MRILSSACCALAVLAGATLLAAPAEARPAHIIVRGATPILPPGNIFDYGNGYYGSPAYIYGDPLDRFYDPAGKIPDWRYYGPPAVDLVLARTLDHNNESLLRHMLRCQASYPTYNPVANTYRGPHGIPQVCYR